ncbi:MAG TPA: hypothetical protein VK861_00185, partial [Bacteroidales bacterium]|nr:hypothetical protein [Bacteroidales bacterium]
MRSLLRVFTFITVFISLLAFSSCSEEFLKKEPKGVAAGSVMTTPDGIESILTGAYAALKGRYMFGGALGTDWVYGSTTSDDCYKGTSAGDSSPFGLHERYEPWINCPYLVQ